MLATMEAPPALDSVLYVYLAHDEYGNELMKSIAMECFADRPELQFVHVTEHAGWHLGFRRNGSVWAAPTGIRNNSGPFPSDHGPIETIRR